MKIKIFLLCKKKLDDKNVNGNYLKVGNNVLLFNEAVKPGINRKFALSYGFYTIMEQISTTNFRIRLVNDFSTGHQEQTALQNRLKRYLGTIGSPIILLSQT